MFEIELLRAFDPLSWSMALGGVWQGIQSWQDKKKMKKEMARQKIMQERQIRSANHAQKVRLNRRALTAENVRRSNKLEKDYARANPKMGTWLGSRLASLKSKEKKNTIH